MAETPDTKLREKAQALCALEADGKHAAECSIEAWEALRAAIAQPVVPLAETAQTCGHPASLLLKSAETGKPLYCELCDMRQQRNDAVRMEQEHAETIRHLVAALREATEAPVFDPEGALDPRKAALDRMAADAEARDAARYRAKRAIDLRKFLEQHKHMVTDDDAREVLTIGFVASFDAAMDAALSAAPAAQRPANTVPLAQVLTEFEADPVTGPLMAGARAEVKAMLAPVAQREPIPAAGPDPFFAVASAPPQMIAAVKTTSGIALSTVVTGAMCIGAATNPCTYKCEAWPECGCAIPAAGEVKP